MRITNATEFKFDYAEYELTAYFNESNKLIHIDADDLDLTQSQLHAARFTAQSDYDDFLKNQEAEAKDWENTKYHLNQQFKVF